MILSPPGFCLRSLLLGSAFLSSSFSVSSGEQVFIQLQNHPLPPTAVLPLPKYPRLQPSTCLPRLLSAHCCLSHIRNVSIPPSTYS